MPDSAALCGCCGWVFVDAVARLSIRVCLPGASAVVAACELALQLEALTDYDRGITFNVGCAATRD